MSTDMIPYSLYILTNGERTYIGITTDVDRRLRQHNGELRGGAKATKARAGSWSIAGVLTGFRNRSEASRWEKIIKTRARGLKKRLEALKKLGLGLCPPGKFYQPPEGLLWTEKSDLANQ